MGELNPTTVQNTVKQTEVNSSTKPFLSLIFGLTLCLILYSLGLITLSKNIHSHTQRQDSNPNKIELELVNDFRSSNKSPTNTESQSIRDK